MQTSHPTCDAGSCLSTKELGADIAPISCRARQPNGASVAPGVGVLLASSENVAAEESIQGGNGPMTARLAKIVLTTIAGLFGLVLVMMQLGVQFRLKMIKEGEQSMDLKLKL